MSDTPDTKATSESENDARDDTVIRTEKVLAFHKLFYLDFKENKRGRFLKMTEKDGRFRSTIIIPEEAISDVCNYINGIVRDFIPENNSSSDDADAENDMNGKTTEATE